MAQQPKVVKMGPGRNAGPRPKVENPGKMFKRILAYVMKQYKFQVILVLCCILLGVFAQVQGTLFMQTLIDSYILPLLACQRFGGKVTWDELGLPCTESGMALPCGATGRWVSE